MSRVSYRPADLDDAELASDVMTAAYPTLPQDPVMTRYRWSNPRVGHAVERFLAYIDDSPAAFLSWYHAPWEKVPSRHSEVEVWLDRSRLDLGMLIEMWSWIDERAVDEGAALLIGYCGEDEPEMLEAMRSVGYRIERTEKAWELDLRHHGDRLVAEASEARKPMEKAGIRLLTVAGWDDPDKLRKLHRLNEETAHDIPRSVPMVEDTFEDFLRRVDAPDRRRDRLWVAVDGDRAVAMSFLKFPPVRGTVWTGYTCTDRDYRGRGIARAVKLQSLAQAVELGIPLVCTDNDSENAPMLHINERLGYVRRPGFIEHHKRVEKSGNA
ncbi:MAG TPA: GNAT family N-acetyltransferase [Candidatus Dormibacteraeota bacterium]|nr:GNAT family N-acetyltransferase [Candidatus Dormibacteraeota bacterium]